MAGAHLQHVNRRLERAYQQGDRQRSYTLGSGIACFLRFHGDHRPPLRQIPVPPALQSRMQDGLHLRQTVQYSLCPVLCREFFDGMKLSAIVSAFQGLLVKVDGNAGGDFARNDKDTSLGNQQAFA